MKIFFSYIVVISLIQPISFCLEAQTNSYPEIGKRCPEFFFDKMDYFTAKSASLNDFRGKLLILDFWSSNCVACIEKFPKINRMQKQFEGQIQFILVGKDEKNIRGVYERFRKKLDLQLPIAYDTITFRQFGIIYVPHLIVIDTQGVVRAITQEIDTNEIKSLLSGKDVLLPIKDDHKEKITYDFSKPFLINGNGGEDSIFLYRSIFTKWSPQMEHMFADFTRKYNWSRYTNNGIQILGGPLELLYRIAYAGTQYIVFGDTLYGNYWPGLLLKVKDSALFNYNPYTGENVFCYSLIVPKEKANNDYLKKIMQRDLANYFGFNIVEKEMMMPCWELVSIDNNKDRLKTKGGPKIVPIKESAGMTLKNASIKDLINQLWFYHQKEPPFIDKSGIKFSIDITLDAVMTDLEDIKSELKKNGLKLVKSQKKMKVIVISE